MKTTNHQHYELRHFQGEGVEHLMFADRSIKGVNPFMVREGTTVEEVLSVIIDRLIYEEKPEMIGYLRNALSHLRPAAQPNSNAPLVTIANMEGRDVGE